MKQGMIRGCTGFAALTNLIFLVGVLRLMVLVLDDRIIGYANTWDMYRIQDCMGIAPQPVGRVVATPEASIQYYIANVIIQEGFCTPSSQLVLLLPANLILSGLFVDVFDLRLVGVTQALLVSALVMAGTYFLARRQGYGAAVFSAIVYAGVYADPVNALYLNTFYAEPAAGVFFLLAMLLGCAILAVPAPNGGQYFAFSVCLLLLGLVKMQYVFFPLLIGLVFSIAVYQKHHDRRLFWMALAAGLACLIGSLYIYFQPTRAAIPMRRANITDTITGAVLPLARDPARALAILNLPPDCKMMIGKDYYSTGVQRNNPCPALWEQGYRRLPYLLADDPLIVLRLVRQSIHVFTEQGTQGAILAYLGQDKEGRQFLSASWGYAFAGFGEVGWAIFLGLPLVVLVVSSIRLVRDGRERKVSAFFLCSFVLASSFYLVYLSSIFGDGWHEFIKHNWMAFNLFAGMGLLWLARAMKKILDNRRQVG